jgi:hypothetical protein
MVLRCGQFVTPAEAGVPLVLVRSWIPAFAGMTVGAVA